jgi:hypothetical protein
MILASLLFLAGSGTALRPAESAPATIEIVNQGRHSIYNLYAAPAGRRRWGPDRFDDATIPVGRSRSVAIPHPPGRCHFRLKLVLADRSTRIRRVDLCRGGRWIVGDGRDNFEPRPSPGAAPAS